MLEGLGNVADTRSLGAAAGAGSLGHVAEPQGLGHVLGEEEHLGEDPPVHLSSDGAERIAPQTQSVKVQSLSDIRV